MLTLPITDVLKNSLNGDYLQTCIHCKTKVLENNTTYSIEKVIKRFPSLDVEETLFEYCLCSNCGSQAWTELSEHSRQSMLHYFNSKQDRLTQHLEKLQEATALEDCFQHCLFTDIPKNQTETYQLIAHCRGTDVLLYKGAFMISDKAAEILTDLLSTETKEFLDDFIDDNFGLPPELKDHLKDTPLFML